MLRPTSAIPWRDVVAIHRLHTPLPVAYVCYALWGAAYATTAPAGILHLTVLAALVGNLLIFTAGLALNSLVDTASDQLHAEKNHLAHAVARRGRTTVMAYVVAEAALGTLLLAVASAVTQHVLPIVAGGAAVVAHLLYNLDPIRLKHRGLVGALMFGLASATLPGLASYGVLRASADTPDWLILTGLGVLSCGRTAWWSVPDLDADRRAGAATTAVRRGPVTAALIACLIMAAGLIVTGCGLGIRYGAAWAVVGVLVHAWVLLVAVTPLVRRDGHYLPSSRWMRTQALTLVTVGEMVLLAVPLLAPVLA